jgi:rhamnosyltransferase
VLVLLATYNGAQHIGEQLQSLADQKGVNVKVVASDDGSKDGTVQLSTHICADLGLPVEFLPRIRPSGSAARNFLRLIKDADLSDCDYVALCDQDDIWLEGKMRRATALLAGLDHAAYSCNSIAFWPDGTEEPITKDYPQRRWDYLFESASHGCTYVLTSLSARLLQSFLAEHSQACDEIEFHDMMIYAWARTRRIMWIMDGERHIRYRQSSINVIGVNSGATAAVVRIRKLRDGWLRNQALKIIKALDLDDSAIARRLQRYDLRDRLMLAVQARHCRRRARDAIVFGLSCLVFGAQAGVKDSASQDR